MKSPSSDTGENAIRGVDLEIATEDDHVIEATLFEPDGANGVAVQINPALAVPRQYYRHFAAYLAAQGFTVLTYDYRGLVRPGRDVRRDRSTVVDWGRYDQAAATAWLADRYPDHGLVLVAHSIGGQIIGLSPLAARFRAIFMVTTAHGYWRQWPTWGKRLQQVAMWYLIAPPMMAVHGYFPGSRVGMFDMSSSAARQMRRFCFNPHWLCDERGRPHRPHNSEVTAPLRHLRLSDDEIVSPGMEIDLDDFYPRARKQQELRTPEDYGMASVGHFGFFRKTMAASAWDEVATWLLDQG